jgi:anti-anti-sigma regulatory factor
MQLELVSDDGDVLRVRCTGTVRREGNSNPLEPLLGFGGYTRRVLLDLGQTESIEPSGVDWLLASERLFAQDGGDLVVHTLPAGVAETLARMHMGRVLRIAANEAAAHAMADRPAPATPDNPW